MKNYSNVQQYIGCVRFDKMNMLKSNFWLYIFGCTPDNFSIISGCPMHVLVVLGEQTTKILNAGYTREGQ